MTNQASEDKLRAELVQYLESTYQDGAVMATRPNSGYHKRVDEFTDNLLALIRTEKLKLLAEVRERVVDKPTGNHNADSLLERDVLIYNQATAYLRTELAKLEAEL